MIGRVLSHYRIVEKIGEGGMGEVYRAEDLRLPRSVAIKILPERAVRSPERRERFIREARAASSLNHPGIVHIYDIDEFQGRLFIAMEYVEGKTLAQIIEERRFDCEEILELAIQVAEALEAAHDHGIIHRDIKPSNIVVAEEGFLKILDFGLAKLLGPKINTEPEQTAPDEASTRAPNLTRAGQLIGTVLYMSPELALGNPIDVRSDIFSFGAVLYEISTGRLPFVGSSEVAILDQVIHGQPAPLEQAAPGLPPELDRIISKALEKKAEDRYQTVSEMVVDLRRLRREISKGPDAGRAGAARQGATVLRAGIWSLLAVGLAVVAALAVDRDGEAAADRVRRTVAVVPFSTRGAGESSGYFTAGITEGVIVDLSRIAGITVMAPSGQQASDGAEDPLGTGRRLGADLVLDGHVQREGGQVRVTAQLREAANGRILWGEIIDRPLEGVFDLQDEISRRIARALEIQLTSRERASIARAPTSSLRAYDLYLRGRDLARRRTEPDLLRAASLYEQALRMDPGFALAHAGLSDAYAVALMYGWSLGNEFRERALEAGRKAIALDSTLPEAHVSMGLVAALEGDVEGGIRRILHAISLEPESAVSHHWLSMLYKRQGRYEEAATEARLALALDPDLFLARLNMAHVAILDGRPREAEERMRSLLQEEPDAAYARIVMAWAQILQGEAMEAVQTLEEAERGLPDDPLVAGLRGMALVAAGDRAGALAAAGRAEALSSGRSSPMAEYAIACIHAQTGDTEEAFTFLARAVEGGRQSLASVISPSYVREDPVLAPLRSDPRFAEIVAGF